MKKIFALVLSLSFILGFSSPMGASANTAPPIKDVYVYKVKSDAGEEYLSRGQMSTNKVHGSNLEVTTLEMGYGKNRFAKMAGSNLREIDREAITQGNTIVGWLITWDASDYNGGYFTYSVTSQNSPWNTMSTSLSIR